MSRFIGSPTSRFQTICDLSALLSREVEALSEDMSEMKGAYPEAATEAKTLHSVIGGFCQIVAEDTGSIQTALQAVEEALTLSAE